MVRARAGHKNAARFEHLQRAKIEFFVSTQCCWKRLLALGKGWRIENDGLELPPSVRPVSQQIECIRFEPLDFGSSQRAAVHFEIALTSFECGTGLVDPNDLLAAASKVQRESTLVAEDVQRVSVRISLRGCVVFALVEKGSGLLSCGCVIFKAQRRLIRIRSRLNDRSHLVAANEASSDGG